MSTEKSEKYVLYALIGFNFIFLLFFTWLHWGDLIIDTFRDQWIAYTLAKGRVLYKDINYVYGILPPYILAFLNKFLGFNILWSILIGVLVTVFTTYVVYRISRLFLNRHFSTLITLSFLYMCAFSPSIFNFILPYSLASTLFIMFTLYSLFFLLKYLHNGRKVYLLSWALFIVLSFLSRISFTFLIWATCSCVLLYHVVTDGKKHYIIYVICPVIVAAGFYAIFLMTTESINGFVESVIKYSFFAGKSSFFSRYVSGFDDFLVNFYRAVISFIMLLLILLSFSVVGFLGVSINKKYAGEIIIYLFHILAAALSVLAGYWFTRFFGFYQFSFAAVMFITTIVLLCIRYFFFHSIDYRKFLSLITIFSVSLILLSRIMLKVSPLDYGFYLIVPSLICYYIFCVEVIFDSFERLFYFSETTRGIYLTCVISFSVFCALPFVVHNLDHSSRRDVRVELLGKGTMYSLAGNRTEYFIKCIEYLKENMAPEDSLVVFPEGIGMNYILEKENPLKVYSFVPEYLEFIGDKNIIKELEDKAVDYIVVLSRDTAEYGARSFGLDYGSEIILWMKDRYEQIKTIGPSPLSPKGFGVAIFKRKGI